MFEWLTMLSIFKGVQQMQNTMPSEMIKRIVLLIRPISCSNRELTPEDAVVAIPVLFALLIQFAFESATVEWPCLCCCV